MSLFWTTGATSETSSTFTSPKFEPSKIHLLVDNDSGVTVEIQFKDPDGTFRAFPDTTLSGNGAKEVIIPRNTEWNVKISGGTAANVEVKLV